MTESFKKYKKQYLISAIVLGLILLFFYLRAVFIQGLWHGDAFLYKMEDGSYKGSDFYAEYSMTVKDADYGADIVFSVNENTKHYQIKYDEKDLSRRLEIVENGTVICKGQAIGKEGDYIVFDDESGSNDMIIVRTGNTPPTEEELFPNHSRLYNWAVSDKTDTRGTPYMLLIIALLGIILFLDIKFPNFFWFLEHGLDVDGGEPSDFYRLGQTVGRVIEVIAIIVCMIMTFTVH